MKVEISLESQQILTLDLLSPSPYPAFFIFSLHKAGSVLLNQIIIDITNYLGIPRVDIAGSAFSEGITLEQWVNDNELSKIIQDGYCYSGFRVIPPFMKDNLILKRSKKILLVRDPRDLVVSRFFSIAYSHTIPEKGLRQSMMLSARQKALEMTIDEYVVKEASFFLKNWNDYHNYLDFNQDLQIFRYEDVIFNKEKWIIDMLEFLNFNIPQETIKQIASKYDIRPTEENPDNHIRKVTPGDHKDKLKSSTIETLNNLFGDILKRYQYT
ncbi:sulfotransferase domain-containing protein [Crocosphaera sp. XPORK-15E]|uniref:sulfotransferase domain-containing protein n=1 Tax=Crocosphaera sp. XPORK-15E TaxID=3110247 RepID=UPI002B1FE47E|nr:sulfotransferase domain-containing protein [Crocosphaera sp. XPORK-15E]MEA5533087.1 sulfotransferase domain-containing protein [Crocosphaera sp. XPORK-15E]